MNEGGDDLTGKCGYTINEGRAARMSCSDYDCFSFTTYTVDGRDENMEARHYDAGCDGGKGVYQVWEIERGRARTSYTAAGYTPYENASYKKSMTEDVWNTRYGNLSEDAKQKFESERTARLAMKLRDGGASAPWTNFTSITPGQRVSMLLARLAAINPTVSRP